MAENQEPDIASRLGGGTRTGVGGSGERVAASLKDSFKTIADSSAKALKNLSDMEKVVDRIHQKVRSGGLGGGLGSGGSGGGSGGRGNAGGPSFSGIRSALGGAAGGNAGATSGGAGGNGGHLNLGLSGFGGAGRAGGGGGGGGAGAAAAGAAEGAPGGGAGGGGGGVGNLISGGLGKMGTVGEVGAAAFKAAAGYGKAHLQDAATLELASSRLAIAGGSQGVANREYFRAGSGLARIGGYNLDDNVQAALTLSNQGVLASGGQGVFGQYQSQVQQLTGQVGGLGAASAAQFVAQSRNTNTIFAGRQIGISTTGKGGVALPADQIARNILKQYKGKSQVGSQQYQQEIAAALDQGAGIDQRINALGYSGEQADVLRQDISQLAAGQDPTKDGPNNPLDKATKGTARSQLETTSQTAKGIADGAADIKDAAKAFRDGVNKLLRASHLGGLAGFVSGAASQVGGPPMKSAVAISGVESQKGGPEPQWQEIEDAVHKLGFQFGTPTSGQIGLNRGGDHGAGRAVDFGDATSDSAAIARALVPYATGPNAAISQLIFSPLNIGYDSGVNKGEKFYGAATWAQHRNHVHVAVKPGVNLAAVVAAGPGSTTGGGASSTGANNSSSSGGGGGGAVAAGIVNSAGDLISEGDTSSLLGATPAAPSASSSSSSSSSTSGSGPGTAAPAATGPLQAYARKLLAQYGWADQWDSFNKLEMSEGGWDPTVSYGEVPGGKNHRGPHGVAYGIPQALPPEKMASAGSDWATSGYTQLRWMMEYIKTKGSSFHDPNSAWAFHQRNNSYASGSWEIERDQYARIHAGEMVVPAAEAEQIRQASGGRGSGASVTINVTLNNASESETMRLVQRVKTELSRDSVLDKIGAS